jgi:hypothetical protein
MHKLPHLWNHIKGYQTFYYVAYQRKPSHEFSLLFSQHQQRKPQVLEPYQNKEALKGHICVINFVVTGVAISQVDGDYQVEGILEVKVVSFFV